MKTITSGFLFLFLIPILFSFSPGNEKPLKIALSKSSPNYVNWLHKGDSTLVIVDLAAMKPEEAVLKLRECDGLLLTGGGDVDPAIYPATGDKSVCTDIDPARDNLEKALIGDALSHKMPILGICRGEQILNVSQGGTLILDIPSYKKQKNVEKINTVDGSLTGMAVAVPAEVPSKNDPANLLHQCDDYTKCFHTVWLKKSSLLYSIIGADTGFVTTNHHQAILKTGKGLRLDAQAADSIAEGIEWADGNGKSFMLGVQWHPERMETANVFSGKILMRFIEETKKYFLAAQKIK
jgi:putative glutamine amidotransferase